MELENKNSKILIISAIAIILILTAGFIYLNKKSTSSNKKIQKTENQATKPTEKNENTPTPQKTVTGSFLTEKTTYKVGDVIKLPVIINSKGEDVVGFDLVVEYNPEIIELKSVTSLNKNYSITFLKREGKVAVTGIELPSVKDKIIFDNQSIVSFNFIANASGKVKVKLINKSNKDVSKIVNSNTQSFPLEGDTVEFTILP